MDLRQVHLKAMLSFVIFGAQFLEVSHSQEDLCRTLEFIEPLYGHALRGHVFKTLMVTFEDNCQLNCYLENDCFSYNLGPLLQNKYLCELSNSDDREHPDDLQPRQGFTYCTTKWNPCSLLPCSPNGKCQNGFTDQEYRCQCKKGYKGYACDQLIWHKINTNPVCFGARDDTFGSFNITQPGYIGALRLVHSYGLVVCHSTSTNSYWGCEVPLYANKTLMTLISYANSRSVLLPRRNSTQMGSFNTPICGIDLTYRLDGFNDSSPELIFNTSSVPLAVSTNQEFWIWYGQDLADCSEFNNYGQSCVDVYGWYI